MTIGPLSVDRPEKSRVGLDKSGRSDSWPQRSAKTVSGRRQDDASDVTPEVAELQEAYSIGPSTGPLSTPRARLRRRWGIADPGSTSGEAD